MTPGTVVRDAAVFDGEHPIGITSVRFSEGRITSVGSHARPLAGDEVIEGRGRTLMPGLIDSHVHASHPGALAQALAFGVTTVLDMFSAPAVASRLRALAAGRDDVADLRSATSGASAPDNWLHRVSPGLPAVAGPEQAAAFVRDRVADGADYLKVYLEDPRWHGNRGLSAATVRALVTAAHQHGLLAVAHADSAAMAHLFLDAGGDGLAHVLSGLRLTPAFAARMRGDGAFAVATLRATAVLSGDYAQRAEADLRALLEHPRLGPFLDPATRRELTCPGLLAAARSGAAPSVAAGPARLRRGAAQRRGAAPGRDPGPRRDRRQLSG
jgi:imidazolonepropionase-like amidohydrolase